MKRFPILLTGFLLPALLGLASCGEPRDETLRICLNPWPGYELLFIARDLGYFADEGLEIDLVEVSSLQDSLHTFLSGSVDGMGCTLVEAAIAADLMPEPPKAILFMDYSDGSDLIIGRGFSDLSELKGKSVGVETASLGLVLLKAALQRQRLRLSDIDLVFLDQAAMPKAFAAGELDASVTYPPHSASLMRDDRAHILFSSADVPYKIVDLLIVHRSYSESHPEQVAALQRVWERVVTRFREKPEDTLRRMAERLHLSDSEMRDAVAGIRYLHPNSLPSIRERGDFTRAAMLTDEVLRDLGIISGPLNAPRIVE